MTQVTYAPDTTEEERLYFCPVFSKKVPLIFIFCLCFLYYSKAQNVRLVSPDKVSLDGAIIVYAPLNSEKSVLLISNNRGEFIVPSINYPAIRRIQLLGYTTLVDTLSKAATTTIITLQPVPQSLGEVTVTGNYLPDYQNNSVYDVDVIGSQEIERRAANNVKDLLGQELNMRISNDPALGDSLSIQGTGGENIKFLVDGVPVIGRQNGNIDLGQLNLANIERVEIVKGPMSVLYGTDALGGVVNLVTKTNTKQKFNGGINAYYESCGQYNMDGALGWGFKNTSINLIGGRNFFTGWSPTDSARWQQWKPKEQYTVDFKIIHSIKNLKFTYLSSYFQEVVTNKSNTVVTPYFAYATDQYYHTQRFNNQFYIEDRLSETSILNFTASFSNYRYIKNTYRKNMVDLTETLTPDSLDDDTTNFKAFFTRLTYTKVTKDQHWSFLVGSEVNYESAIGQRIDNSEHDVSDYALFASTDYKPIEALTIRPSLRVSYNTLYKAPVVPSLNLMYKINQKLTVRASWSRGFRAPSLKEQYLSFVDNGIHNVRGNPDLIAENSNHWLASMEYKKAFTKFVVSVEPSFFYNKINNRISLVQVDPSSNLYTYINLDEYISRGSELQLRFSKSEFHFQVGGSYTGVWSSYDGSVKQPEIAWFAEVNSSADYTIEKTKTTFSVFWKYLGEKPVYQLEAQDNLVRYIGVPYQMMDFSIRQQFIKDRLSITTGLKNIFDVKDIKANGESGGAHSGNSGGETPVGMGITVFAKINFSI